MASLIPGYEYDIFISYRQKDNRHDGWVTEFVENLKGELESTFKEEISVYFDINSHDGLLETHDVEASVKNKLKCLVFIPVLSRTYCDPKSFAWEHEFKAFVEQASHDQFGLKVKLTNGNVACRVLPVRIHDLDLSDTMLFEEILCGVLRGIEFVYEEPGVNRPLTPDDEENKNLKKTRYRNQINKVALALSEIFQGLETEPEWEKIETRIEDEEFRQTIELIEKESLFEKKIFLKNKSKVIGVIIIGLALIFLGYFLIPRLIKPMEQIEKSIAILPFVNDSPNDSTTYFINGIMEEVLNNLSKIKDFSRVLSRTSTDKYRGLDRLTIPEIAKKLGVNYIVEGSGQKYGNKFVLRVQLIVANNENHLWGKSYNREILSTSDIINIQSDIAQSIAVELKSAITPDEKQLINKIQTSNLTALGFYQRGRQELYSYERENSKNATLGKAEYLFHKALNYDSTFAQAYIGLAKVYWNKHADINNMYFSGDNVDSVLIYCNNALRYDNKLAEAFTIMGDYYANKNSINKAIDDYNEALKINPNSWEAYCGKGKIYSEDDLLKCIENFQKAASLNHGLELPVLLGEISYAFNNAGFIDTAKNIALQALRLDNDSATYLNRLALFEFYQGNSNEAIKIIQKGYEIDSSKAEMEIHLGHYYMFLNKPKESLNHYKKLIEILKTRGSVTHIDMHRIGWAYWECSYKKEAKYYFDKQLEYSNNLLEKKLSWGQKLYPYYDMAGVYAFLREKRKAYENLNIFNQRQKMPIWVVTFIKNDPLFNTIRNEPEFQQITKDIEAKYQAEHERVRKWLEENNML